MVKNYKNKIKPTNVGSIKTSITLTDVNDYLVFSFKFLQKTSKFDYEKRRHSYYQSTIERLKAISSIKVNELTRNANALRFHQVDLKKTTEKTFGIKNEALQADENAYQFQISSNEHGRVHGFIVGYIFYVVWLDPDHKLYT
jgi:hypothetical protein